MAEMHGSLSINSENIFPIIKKWLYSDHDIFYRELVSNGCDAITKLKMTIVPTPRQLISLRALENTTPIAKKTTKPKTFIAKYKIISPLFINKINSNL